MDLILRAALLCGTGLILTLILRSNTPELAAAAALAATAVLLGILADGMWTIFDLFREIEEQIGLSEPLFVPLYKTVGISLIVRLGGSLCKDAGESALSAALETAGTVCAFLAAMPLLRIVLDGLMELMK